MNKYELFGLIVYELPLLAELKFQPLEPTSWAMLNHVRDLNNSGFILNSCSAFFPGVSIAFPNILDVFSQFHLLNDSPVA